MLFSWRVRSFVCSCVLLLVLVLSRSHICVFRVCSLFGCFHDRYAITTLRNIAQRGENLPALLAAPPVAADTFVDLLQVLLRGAIVNRTKLCLENREIYRFLCVL